MKALLASRNRGKVREIRKLLSPAGIDVVSLEELSHLGDVKENGATFAQNAVLKAVTMAERSGLLTFADDSGIEVDALGGEPGIYSARFAGEDSVRRGEKRPDTAKARRRRAFPQDLWFSLCCGGGDSVRQVRYL
ncbi:MAG: non-canonical purine NTP pyrophosphatase [Planctomycetota bacterium]|nr:non-canonical purine NTP pyrophosphatase [Planctomycetota bacterium]